MFRTCSDNALIIAQGFAYTKSQKINEKTARATITGAVGKLKLLKAYCQISDRGCSQKIKNLIFFTSLYSYSLRNTFPQRN